MCAVQHNGQPGVCGICLFTNMEPSRIGGLLSLWALKAGIAVNIGGAFAGLVAFFGSRHEA
jgi:hypothetical protein